MSMYYSFSIIYRFTHINKQLIVHLLTTHQALIKKMNFKIGTLLAFYPQIISMKVVA